MTATLREGSLCPLKDLYKDIHSGTLQIGPNCKQLKCQLTDWVNTCTQWNITQHLKHRLQICYNRMNLLKNGSLIPLTPCSSRTFPHPPSRGRVYILALDPGQAFVTALTIECCQGEAMWPLRLSHENALHFHLAFLGWLLSWNLAITL